MSEIPKTEKAKKILALIKNGNYNTKRQSHIIINELLHVIAHLDYKIERRTKE